MLRTGWAFTLSSILLLFSCGTKDIELRTTLAQLPATTPEPMPFEQPMAEPPEGAAPSDGGPAGPPTEGVVIPANPLPDGFEPGPPPGSEAGCLKIDFL